MGLYLLLFQIINKGFSDDFWSKLHQLDLKRKNSTLSESEGLELINMSELIETQNVERIKSLVKLARIRQIDLDTLMNQLGLINGKHI